ncbi:hypothetical protein [Streptomyces hydrogenans]|uniref:hypothetical protein n=1 Tax=Streptomyces hydrogenans TaxID=1873719 RepID=UPI0037F37337
MSLWSLLDRGMAGEELPELWADLGGHVPDLMLWWVDARSIGLGIARWGEEPPFQLLAVVTGVDPP